MIHVITWQWGNKFSALHVHRLRNGLARHLKESHTFTLFSDAPDKWVRSGIDVREIENPRLTEFRGCFVRLQWFSPGWQQRNAFTDRIVCLDLDGVITGPIDPLFDRPEPYLILQGLNTSNPCPFNGALQLLTPGYRPDVWETFSVAAAKKVPFYEFPDDQGWIWHKLPDAAGWKTGKETGVYGFHKRGWPGGENDHDLPQEARIVFFVAGRKSPGLWQHLPWVKEHWR